MQLLELVTLRRDPSREVEAMTWEKSGRFTSHPSELSLNVAKHLRTIIERMFVRDIRRANGYLP